MSGRPGPPAEAPKSDRTRAELEAECSDLRARLSECRSRNQRLVGKLLSLGGDPAFSPDEDEED